MGKAELDSRDIHYRRSCADLGMALLSPWRNKIDGSRSCPAVKCPRYSHGPGFRALTDVAVEGSQEGRG
jgi:hypothetical protein